MDDSFSTVSKLKKQRAVIELLTHESEFPTGIHRHLLAFWDEDTCEHKYLAFLGNKIRDIDRNLHLNNQPLPEKLGS